MEPWNTIAMDIVGPLTKSDLTKWPEAFAIKDQQATTIAKILVEEIICRHGAPSKIISDRGKSFVNNVMDSVNEIFNIQKITTTAYHPQTDGLVEKFNHTLITMLSKYTSKNQKDWDQYINFVLFAYRTSIHISTKETPFMLLYGREPRTPLDVMLNPIQDPVEVDPIDYRSTKY